MIADGAEVGLEPMIQTLDLQWDIGIGGQKPELVSPLFQILLQYPRRERFAIILQIAFCQELLFQIMIALRLLTIVFLFSFRAKIS